MKVHPDDRIHMSKQPLTEIREPGTLVPRIGPPPPGRVRKRPVRNAVSVQRVGMKPVGLWYGFGQSWTNWVSSEMPDLEGTYLYKLTVNTSNVLRINRPSELVNFHRKFSVNSHYGMIQINWPAVASEYSGIEITPYRYEYRLKTNYEWYYGWDVASGCIWKPHVIHKFEEVTK